MNVSIIAIPELRERKTDLEYILGTIPEPVEKSGRVLSASSLDKVRAALQALEALLEAAESEPEPAKATQLTEEATKEAAELEQIVGALKAENEGFSTKEAEARIEAILAKLKEGK